MNILSVLNDSTVNKTKVTPLYSSDNIQFLEAVKPEQQMESSADGHLPITALLTLVLTNIG